MQRKRKLLFIGIGVAVLLVTLADFMYIRSSQGMTQVKGYEPISACLPNTPECGVCPGKVVKNKCFVPKGQ